jgi:hypothetical protein
MIPKNPSNRHSISAVGNNSARTRKPSPTYAEFEIFYLDQNSRTSRLEVRAKTVKGAIGKAKLDRMCIVDASIRSNGEWYAVKLDDLDRVMGV